MIMALHFKHHNLYGFPMNIAIPCFKFCIKSWIASPRSTWIKSFGAMPATQITLAEWTLIVFCWLHYINNTYVYIYIYISYYILYYINIYIYIIYILYYLYILLSIYYNMSCYVMLCYIILYCIILYYIILYYILSIYYYLCIINKYDVYILSIWSIYCKCFRS